MSSHAQTTLEAHAPGKTPLIILALAAPIGDRQSDDRLMRSSTVDT
jgi:hypothetical protein